MQCSACRSDLPDGVQRCLNCGCAIPEWPGAAATRAALPTPDAGALDHAPLQPIAQINAAAERRQLTIAFCDLVESTALASSWDPEDVREVVGVVARRVSEIVLSFNGFPAEYPGDGVLAYFGYPHAHENDAECAIRAALQIAAEIPAMVLLRGYRPQVRIGIATGMVVVGATEGTGVATLRNAAGNTPHLAARLQSLAQPGAVVIDAYTAALVGRLFEYLDLGLAALKGMPEPVRAWQVVGAAPAESRFEAQRSPDLAPLVGRDEEAAGLLSLWQEACTGAGRIVLLSGEAGVGKSRLTATLMDAIAGQPHTRLRYFCSPHLQGSPLHPCIQQLERAAGFRRDDTPERKLERLEAALLPHEGSEEDQALLADLLSLPAADRYPRLSLTPQKRKEKAMEALLRQLDLLSRQQPVLMIFEDAHWIDPSSRELLALCVDLIARRPILLIVTFRPDLDASWCAGPHVSSVVLQPLKREQSARVVEGIAGPGMLSGEVVDDIVDRTDGVPLYIEELTRAVLDQMHEAAPESLVALVPRRESGVPAPLHASLLTRLDRLGDAKELAQIGAAIGREFPFDLLAAVADRPVTELRVRLEQLVRTGLLFAAGEAPHERYLFKHALVQDAAYDTMLRARRQKLHRRIVEVLETAFPDTAEVQPEVLARHSTEGGLIEKASGYWLKAGYRALMRSSMPEAVSRLERGLEVIALLPDSSARHQLELQYQLARGKALIATRGYAEATTGAVFARARELCVLLDQPPQLLAVAHGEWTHVLLRGEIHAARQRADDLLRTAEARSDPLWTMMACRFAGVTCFPQGEFAAGRDHLVRGLGLFDPACRGAYAAVTVDDCQVVMQTYLAYVLVYLGEVEAARAQCQAALAEARRLSQPYSITHALIGTIFLDLYLDFPEEAEAPLAELIALAAEHRIAYYAAFGSLFRGLSLVKRGDAQAAIDWLTRGIAAYRATSSALYLPSFTMWLAEAQAHAGHTDRALSLLGDALASMRSTGMRNDEAHVHRLRGEALLRMARVEEAERCFSTALAVAQRQDAKLLALTAATALARVWRDRGWRSKARQMLEPAHAQLRAAQGVNAYGQATEVLNTLY